MAIEQRERRIGTHTYKVTQFGAKQGRGLLVRVFKLVGPTCSAALSGVAQGKEGAVEAAIALGLGQGVYELAARLTEDEFGSVLDEFAKYTTVVLSADREPKLSMCFDEHFAGRYDEMLLWAAFVLECNYGSFFAESNGAGLLSRLRGVLSASPSPSTSTGTSTVSPPARGTVTVS